MESNNGSKPAVEDYLKTFNPTYDHKTDELNPCVCGFKPQWYSVYYGRTPYDIFCPVCAKQTINYLAFSGNNSTVIQFWNEVVSKTSVPQEIKDTVNNSEYWSQFQKRFTETFPVSTI